MEQHSILLCSCASGSFVGSAWACFPRPCAYTAACVEHASRVADQFLWWVSSVKRRASQSEQLHPVWLFAVIISRVAGNGFGYGKGKRTFSRYENGGNDNTGLTSQDHSRWNKARATIDTHGIVRPSSSANAQYFPQRDACIPLHHIITLKASTWEHQAEHCVGASRSNDWSRVYCVVDFKVSLRSTFVPFP